MAKQTYYETITQPTITQREQLHVCQLAAREGGVAVGALTLVAEVVLAQLLPITWSTKTAFVIVGIACATGVTMWAIRALRWSKMVVTWPVDIENEERIRRWEREDRERERLENTPVPVGTSRKAPLDRVAGVLLQRHYEGESTAREKTVPGAVPTQQEWNQANEAFKMLGWKRGYALQPPADSFEEAWRLWDQRVEEVGGEIRIHDGHGNWALLSPTPKVLPFGVRRTGNG